MREKEVKEETDIDSQVTAMAEDKEIQMELEKINREFAVAELDDLANFSDSPWDPKKFPG